MARKRRRLARGRVSLEADRCTKELERSVRTKNKRPKKENKTETANKITVIRGQKKKNHTAKTMVSVKNSKGGKEPVRKKKK